MPRDKDFCLPQLTNISLRMLRTYSAVCVEGNLTNAARKLRTTQSAVSRVIQNLEAEIGSPLFSRTGRGVEPTAAGELLRKHTQVILDQLGTMLAEFEDLRADNLGEVQTLLPHYVSDVLVPPLVRQFERRFPRAELHVFEESAAEIPRRLAAGASDVGIFYSSSATEGLPAEPIARERMYLVGRRSDIGSEIGAISLRDVSAMTLILPSRYTPFRRFVEQNAAATGCRLRVSRELEVSQSALAFVRDGEGAAVLPLSHFRDDLARGALVAREIDSPKIERTILLSLGRGPPTTLRRQTAALLKEAVALYGAVIGWHVGGQI